MNQTKRTFFDPKVFVLTGLMLTLGATKSLASPFCQDLMNGYIRPSQVIDRVQAKDGSLFPMGSTKKLGEELMFGFESEYPTLDNDLILRHYAPIGHDPTAWLALTDMQRLDWLDKKIKSKLLGTKDSGLVKISSDPNLTFLPQHPIIDDTGNLELILPPVSSFATWKGQVQFLNHTFGTGSQQSMTSVQKQFLFSSNRAPQVNYEENLGTFNFLNTYDILERMRDGAIEFNPNDSRQSLRTFEHPFLGPMSLKKQTYLKSQMQLIAAGQSPHFDAFFVTSSKYIGSTTARPDIGRNVGRMGAEVRDAHTDQQKLIAKTERISLLFMGDRSSFRPFAATTAVDTDLDYKKFSPTTQAMLEKLFPHRKDQTFGGAADIFALEVFRNFAFPLKNWLPDLEALGRKDLAPTIQQAQKKYIDLLADVEKNWKAGLTDDARTRSLIEGYCATFSLDSGLFDAFNTSAKEQLTKIGAEILKGNSI